MIATTLKERSPEARTAIMRGKDKTFNALREQKPQGGCINANEKPSDAEIERSVVNESLMI